MDYWLLIKDISDRASSHKTHKYPPKCNIFREKYALFAIIFYYIHKYPKNA
jgi:hypothetical protein